MIAAAAFVVILLFIWIVSPVFRRGGSGFSSLDPLDDLLEEKNAVFSSILDLDEDLLQGKVTQEEYAAMKRELEIEAAKILQTIDASPPSDRVVIDPIEAEIAAAREELRGQ